MLFCTSSQTDLSDVSCEIRCEKAPRTSLDEQRWQHNTAACDISCEISYNKVIKESLSEKCGLAILQFACEISCEKIIAELVVRVLMGERLFIR